MQAHAPALTCGSLGSRLRFRVARKQADFDEIGFAGEGYSACSNVQGHMRIGLEAYVIEQGLLNYSC